MYASHKNLKKKKSLKIPESSRTLTNNSLLIFFNINEKSNLILFGLFTITLFGNRCCKLIRENKLLKKICFYNLLKFMNFSLLCF